mgnify:CR=1 FL=1
MSHISIIQLEKKPVKKENYMKESYLYEDEILNVKTDYFTDNLSEEDKDIRLRYLRETLDPIVTIDTKKKTFHFKRRPSIMKAFRTDMEKEIENFKNDLLSDRCSMRRMRLALDEPFGDDTLYYYDGYCHTAGMLVDDLLNGWLPKILHIGEIFDGHN